MAHAILGFSLPVCLAFAADGVLFSILAKSTNGLAFTIVIHFISNVCMGMSGIIFR